MDTKTAAVIVGLVLLGLLRRYVDAVARRRRREARLERQREYRRYLKSPEWRERRQAISRAGMFPLSESRLSHSTVDVDADRGSRSILTSVSRSSCCTTCPTPLR